MNIKIQYFIISILILAVVISGFYFLNTVFNRIEMEQAKFEVKYGDKENYINSGITEKNIKKVKIQEYNYKPEVLIILDNEGSKIFEQITGENIGKPVAIFLNGYPISIPTVNEKITTGQLAISGNFTKEEATLLKYRLQGYYNRFFPKPLKLNSEPQSANINENINQIIEDDGTEVHASHLLICFDGSLMCELGLTKEQAFKKITELKEIASPENFANLVKDYSTELGAGSRDGDLGWFGRGVMVTPFEEETFSMKVGTISNIVETQFGYHLIYKKDEKN